NDTDKEEMSGWGYPYMDNSVITITLSNGEESYYFGVKFVKKVPEPIERSEENLLTFNDYLVLSRINGDGKLHGGVIHLGYIDVREYTAIICGIDFTLQTITQSEINGVRMHARLRLDDKIIEESQILHDFAQHGYVFSLYNTQISKTFGLNN